MPYLPQEVVERIFSYLTSDQDRNSVSLVCKDWFVIEQKTRHHVFVANCYAVAPTRVATRFPGLRVLSVKGMPHFADLSRVVPGVWGGSAWPWIRAMVCGCPGLEGIRLKRMVVSDESLTLLSRSFPNFKSLVLVSCQGFSTDGLAEIASRCRQLRELDLQENEVHDRGSPWLAFFPNSFTSLESLKFTGLRSTVNLATLELLVARCPNLRTLHVNWFSVDCLSRILVRAPQLVDLGTGSVSSNHMGSYHRLYDSFEKCKGLKSLSGIWVVGPRMFRPVVNPVCANLLSLKLSSAPWIQESDLLEVVKNCPRLQKLWVLDRIGDKGLATVGSTCKDLRELRVFPSNFHGPTYWLTEEGLIAISTGCPKLNSLLYFCRQMTNAALITVAKNCPNFTRFKLCILDPVKPDPVTNQPLDEGFGAIVQGCKGLKKLSVSGLLTDLVFLYIGMYAECLEMLSVAYAGETDKGMVYVLNGCKNLRKLKIHDCPFGDGALLEDFTKHETVRSLWMSSCEVTIGGCKALAAKDPKLSVEVISDLDGVSGLSLEPINNRRAEKIYIYRTVAGPRTDAPNFVSIL